MEKISVVIIGAGAAGLACARELLESDLGPHFDVTILEARNRVGGRIVTLAVPVGTQHIPIDVGAAWIHGVDRNILADYASRLGIATFASFREGEKHEREPNTYFDTTTGQWISETTVDDTKELFEQLLKEAALIAAQRSNDVPLWDVLAPLLQKMNLTREQKVVLNELLCDYDSYFGPLRHISAKYYDYWTKYEHTGPHVILKSGYAQILKDFEQVIIARGGRLVFNAVVTRIEHSEDSAVAVLSDGTRYTADHIVCTVPLGVLQARTQLEGSERYVLEFDPPLPSFKRKSIDNLGMCVLNKLVLVYPHCFWPETCEFFSAVYPLFLDTESSSSEVTFQFIHNFAAIFGKEVAILVAYRCHDGPTDELSDERLVDATVSTIERMFAHSASGPVPKPIYSYVTHWDTDPYSRGSYSFPKYGALEDGIDSDFIAEPLPHKRLLFAGEHTNRELPACVHGAMLSGMREADAICALYC